MTDFQYWFCSFPVWVLLGGGFISLYVNYQALTKIEKKKNGKKFLIISVIYIILSCYLLGKSNKDADSAKVEAQAQADKKFKSLEDNFDGQTIALNDTHNLVLMIYAIQKQGKTTQPSSLDLVIKHLRASVTWGEKVQVEGSTGDMPISQYIDDRENWLKDIRYFLLTDKTLRGNGRWKNWGGYGDKTGEGFESRDPMTESDYPITAPPDRRDYFRDNGRRLKNIEFYISQLGG